MSIIDKIIVNGYEIKPSDSQYDIYKVINGREIRFLRLYKNGEKLANINMTNTPVVFNFGLKTTNREIFEAYYELDENEKSLLENGYGLRTKKYLDKVQSNIGLVSITQTESLRSRVKGLEQARKVNICQTTPTEIYTDGSIWYAVTVVQHGVDSFSDITLEFDHNPSDYDLKTAFTIRDVKSYFSTWRSKFRDEEFVCQSCGHKQHWLNTPGSLRNKLDHIKNSWCGDC